MGPAPILSGAFGSDPPRLGRSARLGSRGSEPRGAGWVFNRSSHFCFTQLNQRKTADGGKNPKALAENSKFAVFANTAIGTHRSHLSMIEASSPKCYSRKTSATATEKVFFSWMHTMVREVVHLFQNCAVKSFDRRFRRTAESMSRGRSISNNLSEEEAKEIQRGKKK